MFVQACIVFVDSFKRLFNDTHRLQEIALRSAGENKPLFEKKYSSPINCYNVNRTTAPKEIQLNKKT